MAPTRAPVPQSPPTQPPQPEAAPLAPPAILRSNLGEAASAEPVRKRSGFPVGAAVLVVALLVVVAAAAALLLTARGSSSQAPTSAPRVTVTPVEPASGAVNPRRSATVGAPLPVINDISCDALESTIFHIHVHLALFIDGQEQLVPYGIGIGQPWQVSDSAEGPFVENGTCFYWIHTHTEDGVLHIESPVRRTFTLGDFFGIWQQPLSPTQMGPVQGAILAYVNGIKVDTNPAEIRLLSHGRIQLDVGQDVPPYQFDFPPGD
jgi:hypothetical protein